LVRAHACNLDVAGSLRRGKIVTALATHFREPQLARPLLLMAEMGDSKLLSRLLFGTAALSTLGFGLISLAVARGKTSRFDKRAKRRVHVLRIGSTHPKALRNVALGTTPLGKWWGYVPPALATANRLQRRGRTAAARTVAVTAVSAALLSLLLDKLMRRRSPPPERHEPSKQSYPSGHALQASAVAVATSYVLLREGLAPRWSVAPLGLASLAAGAGRLLLDRHWTSDVLGGYFAGVALGTTCAGVYELQR
jgi:membrane-associated phospholipid phosphatase